MQRRSRSDTKLLRTRREVFGDPPQTIGHAIPGYAGHVPGQRHEDATYGVTWARSLEAARDTRSRSTFCPQSLRRQEEVEFNKQMTRSQPTLTAPAIDKRGINYPAAGDYLHSSIRATEEGKDISHHHSTMGLMSRSYEELGGAEKLRGYGRSTRGIPGYCGYVPGKLAENVYADTWSKGNERSLSSHFDARMKAPKKWGLVTEQCTLVAPVAADAIKEVSLFNSSYHDRLRGWSNCQFSGSHIDAAGRLPPRDSQEGYGRQPPPPPNSSTHGMRGSAIHGYAGWVPGRVGENVVGERQCKTNAVADHLFRKARMRNTQR